MKHNPGFEAVVAARSDRVQHLSMEAFIATKETEKQLIIDVREDHEWLAGHIPGAIHLGRGIIERDIETQIPDKSMRLVLYCGGGYRSVLAADMIQEMGYRDVWSLDGGIKAWRAAGLSEEVPVS